MIGARQHPARGRNRMANTQRPNTGQNIHNEEPPVTPAEQRGYLAKQYGYTEAQIDVIRNQICPKASDEELEFFLHTAQRSKLDPFSRQIYFIKRKQKTEDDRGNDVWIEVGRPEVGIEGLRSAAEMTGEYDGQDPVMWCGKDGRWIDVWLEHTPPSAARATIRRKGMSGTVVAVSVYDEYVPRGRPARAGDLGAPLAMWRKMPANQLAKCAEALALRKAFPRDLSGLYIGEEMEHTSVGAPSVGAPSGYEAPALTAAPVVGTTTDGAPVRTISGKAADVRSPDSLPTIASVTAQIKAAATRADLAPVGNLLTKLQKNTDEASRALIASVRPLMTAAYAKLAPEVRR